ncbi:hypothetical protein ABB37_02008 [Leptomonas pyrrhocoris]|uniref:Uncharacterized protein n=1 Tax=Leptomonas pyrrhocoris TaxID=157538 RepID=A0A0N0VGW3_LEPPY|nr:hypothetical protein ABB37_02008 [Leptomonas pyrrhocoris]KPA83784.1 hypothetical protein ABB37_02008 [Leptomonas pyrrhocoris]|eukprot:XP_015662223.1 hypothetical protein ABB37_02008 [Leptomonas pyrrhocoris]
MPPSSIHLRAFELRAGPKTARLVTVSLDRSISEVYTHLCRVLKLDAPLSQVTFHKTYNKKIVTTPLSITAPIGSLGLADDDIFILRHGPRSRSAGREIGGNAQSDAGSVKVLTASQRRRQQLRSAAALPILPGTEGGPLHVTQASSSAVDTEKKEEITGAPITADMEEMMNVHQNNVCMVADRQRMENYQQQFAQYSCVTQVFVMKLFQLLAVLSCSCPTAPVPAPQLGPTRSTVSVAVLHRELLTDFCRRARVPLSRVESLLDSGARNIDAVYEALYYYADVTVQSSVIAAKVEEWLKENLPPLQPAAQMICMLHEGQEAAYLELALLRLRGQVPTAMTWLCLKDAAAPEKRCCYYSAVVRFSQFAAPMHVNAAEIAMVESGWLDSCCVAWGLNNCPYNGHLLPLSCWMWSRLVAAVMTCRDGAAVRLTELLNMYSEWEASLAWVV